MVFSIGSWRRLKSCWMLVKYSFLWIIESVIGYVKVVHSVQLNLSIKYLVLDIILENKDAKWMKTQFLLPNSHWFKLAGERNEQVIAMHVVDTIIELSFWTWHILIHKLKLPITIGFLIKTTILLFFPFFNSTFYYLLLLHILC